MKKLLCFVTLQALALTGFSQIANNDFEEWSTTSIGQDSAESWSCTNHAVHNITSMITTLSKTTTSYSLSYGAKLETVGFGFVQTPVVAILVNGDAKLDFDASHTSYISGGGSPVTVNPLAFKGYYYIDGSYPGLIEVLLSKYNTTTHQRDTIGLTSHTLSVTATHAYVPFSFPLNYSVSGVTADSITVVIYSSKPSVLPAINSGFSSLYIDSVGLENPFTDAALAKISNPSKGATVSTSQTVEAWVKNIGSLNITTFDISYTVNGANKVTETYNSTLASKDSVKFTFSQTWTPTAAGSVDICVFLDGLASDVNLLNDTACVTLTSNLDLSEVGSKNSLSVYPNPANDHISIETATPVSIELLDVKGKLVYAAQSDGSLIINTSNLPKGIYICRIHDEKGIPLGEQKISVLH